MGVMPIDSLFSRVKKVNSQVTNARVGQATDYDRLSLEVWSNGSVTPADAVAFAAKIVREQLSIFINFDETEEPAPIGLPKNKEKMNENPFPPGDRPEPPIPPANS